MIIEHMRHLDEVEEMVSSDQAASLYWGDRIRVASGAFASQWVWVYRYNLSVVGLQCIFGGDYRRYLLGSQ